MAELIKRAQKYNKTIGTQTVQWQDEELTLTQLATHLQTPDRAVRQQGWQMMAERRLQDRAGLNDLWRQLFALRQQMAHNAGYDDFRAFTWQQKGRFDYSPQDAETFHQAILEVGVPAANRVYERYRQHLGVERLRPWDVTADVFIYDLPALRPFRDIHELTAVSSRIFHQVDPVLGECFDIMRQDDMLDLPNRKGKGPGAYCAYYPVTQRPFIFMNSVGTGDDIRTILHEAGHAFHNFARGALPYRQQKSSPMEFSEVASMAMELLATPYITKDNGGFFTPPESKQWRQHHLEKIILFWPYMAVVDGFQHWAYTHKDGSNPLACDAKWAELWQQYLPAIDFSGYEEVMMTGWHRKQHIFRAPFYYIEYGLAQLGALQVWRNALSDQAGAVAAYRQALALGGTRPLPDLYAAANTRFAFDHTIMSEMIQLLEEQLYSLSHANGSGKA
jgi:oligoendopeptidase F